MNDEIERRPKMAQVRWFEHGDINKFLGFRNIQIGNIWVHTLDEGELELVNRDNRDCGEYGKIYACPVCGKEFCIML